jgi:hypothetical protein
MVVKEVDNEGCVRCPQCNNVIDPEDFSDSAYEVLEAILNERNGLIRVIVRCNVCKSDIAIALK